MSDGRPSSSEEIHEVPEDLRFYGTATPSQTHAIVLPKQAREELALDGPEPVFVFGSPSQKRAILAAAPAPGDLLSLLTPAAGKQSKRR